MISEMDEKQVLQRLNAKAYQLCSSTRKTKRDKIIMQKRLESLTYINPAPYYQFPMTQPRENNYFRSFPHKVQEDIFGETENEGEEDGIAGMSKAQFCNLINANLFNIQNEPRQIIRDVPIQEPKAPRHIQQPNFDNFKPVRKQYVPRTQKDELIYQQRQIKTKRPRYVRTNIKLGQGSESIVYKGIDTKTGAEVAIKVLVSDYTDNQIDILKNMTESQNVLKMYDYWIENGKMCIALQLCDDNLQEKVKCSTFQQRVDYFKQILNGMKHLSRNCVLHRDIKLRNILIKDDVVKLSDFGFAKYLGSKLAVESRQCGTPATMAPEVLFASRKRKIVYNRKSDIWSLGVILHELIYDCHPFDYDSERTERCRRVRVKRPIEKIQRILDQILILDCNSRIGLGDLIMMYRQFLDEKNRIDQCSGNRNNIEEQSGFNENYRLKRDRNAQRNQNQRHQHQTEEEYIRRQLEQKIHLENMFKKKYPQKSPLPQNIPPIAYKRNKLALKPHQQQSKQQTLETAFNYTQYQQTNPRTSSNKFGKISLLAPLLICLLSYTAIYFGQLVFNF